MKKEEVIGITTATEHIEPQHYVTVYYDEKGHLKIRKSIQGDEDFIKG